MGESGRVFALILVFLIVSSSSNASNSTTNSSSPSPEQGSQVDAAAIGTKGLNESLGIGKERSKETQRSGNLTKVDLKGSSNGSNTADGIPPSKLKGDEVKGEVDNATKLEEGSSESCKGALQECSIENTLLACLQMPKNGSKDPFLVLRNEGEIRLEVKFYSPAPVGKGFATVSKHQTIRVNISSTLSKGSNIVVDGGNGSCELQLRSSVSMDSLVQQLSLYSKQVTPIYGAFFLFLGALLFGGTWASCKLRKKRQPGGVPYQELEMGVPESSSAVNVDTADGWDDDWDDDWDEEENAGGGHRLGSISANGLTARSAKKDGWENDWDD